MYLTVALSRCGDDAVSPSYSSPLWELSMITHCLDFLRSADRCVG